MEMDKRVLLVIAGDNEVSQSALGDPKFSQNVVWCHPRDLSVAGWRFDPARPEKTIAMSQDGPLPMQRVAGVLMRLSWISEKDLSHIASEDRNYIAAEMRAFLLAWLSGFRRPVINRPTPLSLCGPGWRYSRWMWEVNRAGIPVDPEWSNLQASFDGDKRRSDKQMINGHVSVCGHHAFGHSDRVLKAHALSLADAAGTELLDTTYRKIEDKWHCRFVNPRPPITTEIASAIFKRCEMKVDE